jgi:hypothetical protein
LLLVLSLASCLSLVSPTPTLAINIICVWKNANPPAVSNGLFRFFLLFFRCFFFVLLLSVIDVAVIVYGVPLGKANSVLLQQACGNIVIFVQVLAC